MVNLNLPSNNIHLARMRVQQLELESRCGIHHLDSVNLPDSTRAATTLTTFLHVASSHLGLLLLQLSSPEIGAHVGAGVE